MPPPEVTPAQEKAFAAMMENLHSRWRLFIFVPMLYLMLAFWMRDRFSKPSAGMDDITAGILLAAGIAGGMLLWAALARLRRRQARQLSALRDDPRHFPVAAREHQMRQFFLCDLVCLPGLVFFIAAGRLYPLIGFCFASMVFYLKAMPSEKQLGQAIFRPDQLE